MKTIPLKQIPLSKPYLLILDSDEKWLVEVFDNALPHQNIDKKTITGNLKLYKTNQVIDIIGNITFSYFSLCSRCGKELKLQETIQFNTHQAPLDMFEPKHKKSKGKKDKNEPELSLTEDDLNFSFYKNEEIRIDTMINDELVLEVPTDHYCKDTKNCKMDCCDKNITVTAENKKAIDPRWLPLKNLKKDLN